jgi:hypothetical protein
MFMARTRAKFNAATIKKWIAEGRGQGDGREYRPWLTVQNVPSIGYVHRILGWITKRRHEFLSNLEANYFSLLDWSRSVTDAREQYHKDLAADGVTPQLATCLLDACQSAWVFGGMGSWNDMGFEGAEKTEYDRVSDHLFTTLNETIQSAANASFQ